MIGHVLLALLLVSALYGLARAAIDVQHAYQRRMIARRLRHIFGPHRHQEGAK